MENVIEQPKEIALEMAIEFGLDFQELANEQPDHIEAMKDTMRLHLHNIDRQKSFDQPIAFVDGTTATWYGAGFRLGKI